MSTLVTPDFNDVQDDLLEGEYNFRIVEGVIGEWNNERGKTQYINWTLETIDEEDAKNNGRKMWDRTPISGKGAFRFKNFFKAATGNSYDPAQGGFDLTELYGHEIGAVLLKNDQGYMNIKSYKPVS
jgi:hypothetical protein